VDPVEAQKPSIHAVILSKAKNLSRRTHAAPELRIVKLGFGQARERFLDKLGTTMGNR
jgi:hypothetical protein